MPPASLEEGWNNLAKKMILSLVLKREEELSESDESERLQLQRARTWVEDGMRRISGSVAARKYLRGLITRYFPQK